MSDPSDIDLSAKDIRFLKAIRDITDSPGEYPHTDVGEAPASKTAIRAVTDFGDEEIDYRLRPSLSKLTVEDGAGYIESHSPTVKDDGGFGPRSATLTDAGERALDIALEERDLLRAGVTVGGQAGAEGRDELEAAVVELQEQMTEMEAKLERVLNVVDEWEESPTGAFDEDQNRAFEALTSALPAHNKALKALGISPSQVGEAEDIDPTEVRANVRESLHEEGGQPAAAESEGGAPGDQSDFDSLQSDS